jgi:hypothetical protein
MFGSWASGRGGGGCGSTPQVATAPQPPPVECTVVTLQHPPPPLQSLSRPLPDPCVSPGAIRSPSDPCSAAHSRCCQRRLHPASASSRQPVPWSRGWCGRARGPRCHPAPQPLATPPPRSHAHPCLARGVGGGGAGACCPSRRPAPPDTRGPAWWGGGRTSGLRRGRVRGSRGGGRHTLRTGGDGTLNRSRLWSGVATAHDTRSRGGHALPRTLALLRIV